MWSPVIYTHVGYCTHRWENVLRTVRMSDENLLNFAHFYAALLYLMLSGLSTVEQPYISIQT